MSFRVGDKVYVGEGYRESFGPLATNWVNRPGVVVEIVPGFKSPVYYVNLPAWNGLPEFNRAVFRESELNGDL